jgi:amidase
VSDLCFLPAYQLRQQILSKSLSARELLSAFEQRIERHNPVINALVTLDFEQAYRIAQQADDHLARSGESLGPLHGLPLAVKDIFQVAGMRTTFGNLHYQDHISAQDDLLVQREKAAGAVIIGKSNTPDCACGGVTTNEIFGLTRNPWNHQKTTSGSGGGGAAAIASGLVCMADGSDVGGSIRTPAAWANCVGFRPSSGRIPDYPGSIADGNISTAGVFTRSVMDVDLFMQAVEGPNLHSAFSHPFNDSSFSSDFSFDANNNLPNGKVAWVKSFAGTNSPDDINQCMQEACGVLKRLGVFVEEVDLGLGDAFRQLFADVNAYAVVDSLPEKVLAACLRGETTKPSIKATVERYLGLSSLDLQRVWQDVAKLKVKMQLLMEEYPFLIFPTNAGHAFDLNNAQAQQDYDWATLYLAPMLGLPSISVPAGFTQDGMPFGMMITGRAGEDTAVLQIAAKFEQETLYYQLNLGE